jgi:phosphohistidine phosphatase
VVVTGLAAALALFVVTGESTAGLDRAGAAQWLPAGIALGVLLAGCLGVTGMRLGPQLEENGCMPRRLTVLRHAKSAWPDGVADHLRPLGARGRREAPLAGQWLREHVGAIDIVVCSSAERVRQTWALVAPELDPIPDSRVDERLYDATTGGLLAVIRELPDECGSVLFIGHNPDLESLVGYLTGSYCLLKTSSLAVMSGDGPWTGVGPGWATLDAEATARP